MLLSSLLTMKVVSQRFDREKLSLIEYNLQTIRDASKKRYQLLLISVIIWCSLILAAPILAKLEHRFSAGLIYLFFSRICHQIPERSFFIFGKQLAVCSRCTGLYFGFLLGTILYPFLSSWYRFRIPARKYLFMAGIPMAIDIFVRTFHIAENSFTSRFITGLILGGITALFVTPGILTLRRKTA